MGYGGLLFSLRLVTVDELGVMWRAVRRPSPAASDGEAS